MAEAMLSNRKLPSIVPSITVLPRVITQPTLFEIKEDAALNQSARHTSKDSGIELDDSNSPKKPLYPAEPNLGEFENQKQSFLSILFFQLFYLISKIFS